MVMSVRADGECVRPQISVFVRFTYGPLGAPRHIAHGMTVYVQQLVHRFNIRLESSLVT
jgi:hypothetical protein